MIHYTIQQKDKDEVLARFIKYCKIDSQSQHGASTTPSTQKQFNMAKILASELEELGISASVSEKCYVYAKISGNSPSEKTIGFITHMDVAHDSPSSNIQPIVHKAITGEPLTLPSGVVISKEDLNPYVGHDIVTSDGTTLLGADDKSAVAAVMQLVSILQEQGSKIPHGDILICFTPDEEVSQGTAGLDLTQFHPDGAYTIDGGGFGEVTSETFNAAQFILTVKVYPVHLGKAYNSLVNAVDAAAYFTSLLPEDKRAELSKDREGYIHLSSFEGNSANATVTLTLRSFDEDVLNSYSQMCEKFAEETRQKFPKAEIKTQTIHQYYNISRYLTGHEYLIDNLITAITLTGTTPTRTLFRGGFDGCLFGEMGIPTANLAGAMVNLHSVREFCPLNELYDSLQCIINLVSLFVIK